MIYCNRQNAKVLLKLKTIYRDTFIDQIKKQCKELNKEKDKVVFATIKKYNKIIYLLKWSGYLKKNQNNTEEKLQIYRNKHIIVV